MGFQFNIVYVQEHSCDWKTIISEYMSKTLIQP